MNQGNHLKEHSSIKQTQNPGGNSSIQIGWSDERPTQNHPRLNKQKQAEDDKAKQAEYYNAAMMRKE